MEKNWKTQILICNQDSLVPHSDLLFRLHMGVCLLYATPYLLSLRKAVFRINPLAPELFF